MMWKGRFSKDLKNEVLGFNSAENIMLDQKLVRYDILSSIAHVKMLAKQEILEADEAEDIIKALKEVLQEWESGSFKLDPNLEDVHMNIESAVSKKTPHGKKMHTARSRNDQVLLDMRMYMRDSILEVAHGIEGLQKACAGLEEGLMVGYTHTRVAQPITVSFWAEAIVQGLQRDMERLMGCFGRVNSNPLGAGALAGTGWDIDRGYTAEILGFESVQENELDTISSRGEMEAELLSHLSILMTRLSGLAEELIWLSEKGLIELPDELCTGSSMMPNKKNPDLLELVRGRTGRVHGGLTHVLSVKKGLISGYHSDMQETKYAVMQGIDTAKAALGIMALVMKDISFEKAKIAQELDRGFSQATEIADYLAMRGVPFREAHERAGKLVKHCETGKTTLPKLPKEEAEGVLGVEIPEKEWAGLISVERARLQKKVMVPENKAKEKAERIQATLDKL